MRIRFLVRYRNNRKVILIVNFLEIIMGESLVVFIGNIIILIYIEILRLI